VEKHTFERLIEVGRALTAELDLDALLGRVLEVARDLTGARYAAVGVLDERREQLERFITAGIPEEAHARIGDLPRGRGVLGLLIRDPKPLRMPDVSRHMESYGFPLDHPRMGSFLGVPILVGDEAWGNLYLTEKDVGDFTQDDEDAMVVLADWAAIAIGNARLYRNVRQRRDELERAVRTLETTTEIARAVGGEVDLDRVLELVAKRGRALVAARALLVVLAEGADWRVAAAAGDVEASAIGRRVPVAARSAAAWPAGRSQRIDRLPDVGGLPELGTGDTEAALIVPLRFHGRPVGAILAFDRVEDGPQFKPEDERLLEAFAAAAATAVATAQQSASQALERSMIASERERQRWARELHDETLQEMAGLRLLLAGARRSDDIERVHAAVDEGMERITVGIANLRSLITDLRPAALDELGPQAALEALVERVHRQSGLSIELEVDLAYEEGRASDRHVPEIEETIYRVVQEALTNVVKHAGPTKARVYVGDSQDGDVVVRVTDDGKGFDPTADREGFGLTGMLERVALVHGALEVESSPGEGTTLHATLPARRRGEERAEPPAASASGR
jgi:signal transduction histidine kinase